MVDTASVLKLAAAIQVQEGWNPGTLSYRNNNPGNLRFVGQSGATVGAGGYAAFPSYDAGLAALIAQIQLDASRGTDAAGRPVVTVSDLITSWAPPSENPTKDYIASVERQTGFSGSDVLNSLGSSDGGTVTGDPSAGGGSSTDDGTAGDSMDSLALPSLSTAALIGVGIASAAAIWLVIR